MDSTTLAAKSLDAGQLICAPLVDAIIGTGVSALPKDAECTGGPAADVAKLELIAVCMKNL